MPCVLRKLGPKKTIGHIIYISLYIKGGSKFSKPLLSRDTDSLSDKTLGYQRKHAPSGISLFTLYSKNKVIS